MPKYIAIAAITLDGKIAKHKDHLSDWTSKEDKDFLHAMLDKYDVILVGNNTYKTAIKPLSKRNCVVLSRSADKLVSRSAKLQYCNPQKSDIKKIIRNRKYKTIAILGGAQTYTYCLQHNLLDELYLTIEPLVFGQGINLFAPAPSSLGKGKMSLQRQMRSKDYKFRLVSIKELNKQGSLLLHYIR